MNKNMTRDNVLYLLIALAIVGLIWVSAENDVSHGKKAEFPISFEVLSFASTTCIVFGYAIRQWRKAWRSVRLWAFLALFLMVIPFQ